MSDLPDNPLLPETPSDSSVALGPASHEPTRILYAEDRPGSLLAEYFRTLSRYRRLILVAAICGVVVSFLMSFSDAPCLSRKNLFGYSKSEQQLHGHADHCAHRGSG